MRRIKICGLLICLLFMAAACSAGKPAVSPSVNTEAAKMDVSDMTVDSLAYGAGQDAVRAQYGTPTWTEKTAENTEHETWLYENEADTLALSFESGRLMMASWQSKAYTGPRGIKVGMTKNEVLALFYHEAEEGVLYSSGIQAGAGFLPPYAVLDKDEEEQIDSLYFIAPAEEYGEEIETFPEDYRFYRHATLEIVFGSDETVISIQWNVNTLDL